MASKYIALLLVLQIAQSCFGANTVVDLDTDLTAAGSLFDSYHPDATNLPAQVPEAIKTSNNKGIWLFKEETTTGGSFVLNSATAFDKITLKVYSTVAVTLNFEDESVEPEIPVPAVTIPVTPTAAWTEYTFDLVRETVSTETFSLKVQLARSATQVGGLLLVDTITIEEPEEVATTTEEVTSTTPAENVSSAITPTLATFVFLAIFKALM